MRKIKSLIRDEKRDLLLLLTEALAAERKSMACYEQLCLRVQGPWLKEQLERLAREDQTAVARLEDKIINLGGRLDTGTSQVSSPGSVAQELIRAWENERNGQEILRQELGLIKEDDVRELLAALLEQKKAHLVVLRDLIMRYS